MEKIDLKKELRHLYGPSAKGVAEVRVPPLRYLMVDGQGDPNTSEEYKHAVEALFTVSYMTKFAIKKGPLAIDYTVMPLEGGFGGRMTSRPLSRGRKRIGSGR